MWSYAKVSKFREVIAGELQRSKFYRDYFDKWGSRYYVFSSELQALNTDVFLLAKESVLKYNAKIVELRFNTKVFKSMGGEYVFSTVRIENAEKINLELLRVLERDDSPCRIFVYQVKLLDQVNVHDQAKLADKYSALNEAYIL